MARYKFKCMNSMSMMSMLTFLTQADSWNKPLAKLLATSSSVKFLRGTQKGKIRPPGLLAYLRLLPELLFLLILGVNNMTQEGGAIRSLVPNRWQYLALSSHHLESLLKEWTLFWIASVGITLEKVSAFSNHWEPIFYMVSAEEKRGHGLQQGAWHACLQKLWWMKCVDVMG